MAKVFKGIFIALGVIIGILVLTVGSYLIYITAAYYRLEDNLKLDITDGISQNLTLGQEYSAMTYNVGFGAYSPDFTFFMDGGKESVAKNKDEVLKNINGSIALLENYSPDIAMIQEIDLKATRSYKVDQLEMFKAKFVNYDSTFAMNYDSPYLFYPFNKPHGKSKAGINTFAKYNIDESTRRSLPISTSFSKFFDLDRCYSVNRMPIEGGKYLYVYNIHMSAYGGSPEIRSAQVKMLFDDMKEKISKGDYAICGGDFNHLLAKQPGESANDEEWAQDFPFDAMPEEIKFADKFVDSTVPTCRDCSEVYTKGSTKTWILDGFFVSDNIEVVSVENIDKDFEFSDHNPVLMKFKFM